MIVTRIVATESACGKLTFTIWQFWITIC